MAKNLVLAKAQNAVLAHDWATAARLYKELLRGNESNVDYLKELGSIYVKAGEDEKAIPYYEQIITFYPHYIEAMNSLGAIYRRLKRYEESIAILQKALDEGRNETAVKYNLGFTYKEMGNYEDAIDSFESVISNNPDDVLAYNHLGSIYFAEKDYEKSIASFRRGLQVDPNHPILNYNLARCYEADKNYTDAVRYYETSLRTRPGWTDAIRDFSGLLIKCQENSKAQDLVEKSIKLHPRDADLLCILGRIFLNQFDYDNATKTYKKAEALKGNDVKILTCLSEALEKGDKIDQALEKALEAVEIDPYNKDAKKQYIHSLLSAQRYDQAYENVTALNEETQEKDLQVLDLYAQYYICRGDEKNAQEYHNKIKKINHHYKDYMLSASDRYAQIGELNKAEQFAKEFVERRGQLPDGYNRLGKIAIAKGDYKTAKLQFEQGIQKTKPNIVATKGLEKINEELVKNPDLLNYETPVIEVDAEKIEDEKEPYMPPSFIGEVVGAEPEEQTADEENNFDYSQLGENVPLGEALVENEDDFWEDFDDDPNAEPLANEENLEEEEEESDEPGSVFGDDLLDSLAQTGADNNTDDLEEIAEDTDNLADIASTLGGDDDDDFDFDELDGAKPNESIEDAPVTEVEEPVEEPEAPVQMEPAYQKPAYDPYERQMQSAAMNSAGTAMEAAVIAQKMAQQLTEQQKKFEEELTAKSEHLIKESVDEAVEKAVEEKMQKSMDDQMERIMSTDMDLEEDMTENPAEVSPDVPEDDFDLPLGDEEIEVEVEPIDSIMNPEKIEHDEMDDFLSTDDFAEEDPVEETAAEEAEDDFADVTEFATEEEEAAEEAAEEEAEDDFADVTEFATEDEAPAEEASVEEAEDDFADVTDFATEEEAPVEEAATVEEAEDDFADVTEFVTEDEAPAEEAAAVEEAEDDFADVTDFATEDEAPVEEKPAAKEMKSSLEEELKKIELELSNPDLEIKNAEQIELFKTLRVLSSYLPDNEKDSFLSCRIRMIIEYIIAKMSGKPGLLITAETLLKSGVLGEEYKSHLEAECDEDLSNDLIKHVLKYMKNLAGNLEDSQLSKALCLSADNILEQIELINQKSQIF